MNWVKARAGCTMRSIFEQLRERVQSDVEEAGRELAGGPFELIDDAPGYFFVRAAGKPEVKFLRGPQCISVESVSGEVEFYVKHRWDDDTDACILTVDGNPLELWQVSKKALSGLFFG